MLFNYTQMKMAHYSWTLPNMSSIREVCDRLPKIFLTSLVGNHWATGGLLVNLSSVTEGLIIFALFLLEGKVNCGIFIRQVHVLCWNPPSLPSWPRAL